MNFKSTLEYNLFFNFFHHFVKKIKKNSCKMKTYHNFHFLLITIQHFKAIYILYSRQFILCHEGMRPIHQGTLPKIIQFIDQ